MNKYNKKKYDLEERTTKFGMLIMNICKDIVPTVTNRDILSQLVRSATSIGANYYEANGAISKDDFRNKINIVQKETRETKHWIRLLAILIPEKSEELRKAWQEAHELSLIFGKVTSTLRAKHNLKK